MAAKQPSNAKAGTARGSSEPVPDGSARTAPDLPDWTSYQLWTLIEAACLLSDIEPKPATQFDKDRACGAKGGDIIALHRLLIGCGFVQAVRELGARLHE